VVEWPGIGAVLHLSNSCSTRMFTLFTERTEREGRILVLLTIPLTSRLSHMFFR